MNYYKCIYVTGVPLHIQYFMLLHLKSFYLRLLSESILIINRTIPNVGLHKYSNS